MTVRIKRGVPQTNGSLQVEPTLDAQQVARVLVYMARRPPEANVPFVTVMAAKMPFLGRG
jgi:NADP-dependent 3-hydroxy acid dehydrogenase YdfG